jgi:hypothetical protein
MGDSSRAMPGKTTRLLRGLAEECFAGVPP